MYARTCGAKPTPAKDFILDEHEEGSAGFLKALDVADVLYGIKRAFCGNLTVNGLHTMLLMVLATYYYFSINYY